MRKIYPADLSQHKTDAEGLVSDLSRIEGRLGEIVDLLRWLVEETRKGNAERETDRTPGRVHARPTRGNVKPEDRT